MSWTFNSGDRYHTQDTSYYCGAACAMMILAEIGVPYASLDQDDLYDSNHSHNARSGWYTDPYGLCYTLNDRRPASFLPRFFVVYKRLTEAEGTRDAVFTLYHYHVSPAILVYDHWNVVCGVQTDGDPTSGLCTVEGFWLNNPVWDSSISSHNASDTCGSGGAHGVANEFVTYAEWQTNRFNGCAYDDPGGATQWISVCDPDQRTISLPKRRAVKYRSDAAACAAGHAGLPLLVTRLDTPERDYYLVPWQDERGIVLVVQVDAWRGATSSAAVLPTPLSRLVMSPDEARRAVSDRLSEHVIGEPKLVWRPCHESASPFQPLYQVAIEGGDVFVGVDGSVYRSLTPFGKGG